jgi:hypothetical protein
VGAPLKRNVRRQGKLPMNFERSGFSVVERVISDAQRDELVAALPPIESSGSRVLLSLPAFRDLVPVLRAHAQLITLLGDLVAVECIHFRKSSEHNWAVTLHRDSVLPVFGDGEWQPVGTKEGMACAKPPREFMDRCIAVRLHLDGAPVEDISVVPRSHLDAQKYERSQAVPVAVAKCGALLLRPTLAHASSKLQGLGQRRVLHYVFAPRELPFGYGWHAAA